MPATATMGRMRRRVSAAAFCQFICCGVSPALADLRRLGRALAVVVRSLEESEAFQVSAPYPSAHAIPLLVYMWQGPKDS